MADTDPTPPTTAVDAKTAKDAGEYLTAVLEQGDDPLRALDDTRHVFGFGDAPVEGFDRVKRAARLELARQAAPGGAGTATPPDPGELIRRLSSSLQDLIENSDDPGTEALAAVWEGRQYAQTGAAYTDVRPRNFLVEAAVAAYAAAHQVPVNRVTEGDDGGVEAVRAALAAATPGEPSPPADPGDLIGRTDDWWVGYSAGCDAAHAVGCSAVEAERDDLRERLTRTEKVCEERITDLQQEFARQIKPMERRWTQARLEAERIRAVLSECRDRFALFNGEGWVQTSVVRALLTGGEQ